MTLFGRFFNTVFEAGKWKWKKWPKNLSSEGTRGAGARGKMSITMGCFKGG